MTSELSFKKEFEDVIFNQNYKEALNSLIPNSSEYIYLQFCEEYKKCYINKKISKELDSILKKAKSEFYNLYKILNTRKILLEYDLSSTSQKRKNEIIDELDENYCNGFLEYDAPFFVREKKKEKNEMIIENDEEFITELNDDIIKNIIEKEISENDYISPFQFQEISFIKRKEYLLKYIERKTEDNYINIIVNIINYNKIPFYLMTKEEFSKIINFYNKCNYNINKYDNMTLEQIERLKEVNNPKYISKNKLISKYIQKKYYKLINETDDNLN